MILYRKQSISLIYPVSTERIPTGIPGFDERIDNGQSLTKKGLIKGTLTAIISISARQNQHLPSNLLLAA